MYRAAKLAHSVPLAWTLVELMRVEMIPDAFEVQAVVQVILLTIWVPRPDLAACLSDADTSLPTSAEAALRAMFRQ